MTLFDTLPIDVTAETMKGVDDVLRTWLKAKTNLVIWYGGEGGKWLVIDEAKLAEDNVPLPDFKSSIQEAVMFTAYSYADCVKWLLAKADETWMAVSEGKAG